MHVNAEVTKNEVIGALRDATIDNGTFEASEWSHHDVEVLRRIADLVERELNAKWNSIRSERPEDPF